MSILSEAFHFILVLQTLFILSIKMF